jgi:hypothetical protein
MTTERRDTQSHEAMASSTSDPTLSPSNWHDVFDQIDRIEQRQSDLQCALWEQLLCRLERLERNQAELNHMVLHMEAERPEKGRLPTAKGLALGSPIESVEPPSRAPSARPDMGLPPFARSFPTLPLFPDPTSRAIADVEPPGSPGDEEVPMQESSAPSAEPTPAREPSWMPVPLPEGFKLPKANGGRRWFFGRHQYVGMAPDFLWAPSQPTGAVREAPPAPPGFISTEATTPSTTPTEPLTEPESETSGEEPSEPAQPQSVNECQSDNTDDPTTSELGGRGSGEVNLDEQTRSYIRERLAYPFVITEPSAEAL